MVVSTTHPILSMLLTQLTHATSGPPVILAPGRRCLDLESRVKFPYIHESRYILESFLVVTN